MRDSPLGPRAHPPDARIRTISTGTPFAVTGLAMGRWLAAVLVLALAACGSESGPPPKKSPPPAKPQPPAPSNREVVPVSYQIDNTTADPWSIELDGDVVGRVAPYAFVTLKTTSGPHTFRFLNEARVAATVEVDFVDPITVVNPIGRTRYTLVTAVYPGGVTTNSFGDAKTIGVERGLGDSGSLPEFMMVKSGAAGLIRKVYREAPAEMTAGAAEALWTAPDDVYTATDADYERAFVALQAAGALEAILKGLEDGSCAATLAATSRVDRYVDAVPDERVASWLGLPAGDSGASLPAGRFEAAARVLLRRGRGELLFPAFEAANPNIQQFTIYILREDPAVHRAWAAEYFRTLGALDGDRRGLTGIGSDLQWRIQEGELPVDAELARVIDDAVRNLTGASRERWRPWWIEQRAKLGGDAAMAMMYADAEDPEALRALIDRGLVGSLNGLLRAEADADRRVRIETLLASTMAALPQGASAESLLAAATDGTSEEVVSAGLSRLLKHGTGHLKAVLDGYGRIERAENRAWLVGAAARMGDAAFAPMFAAARDDADATVRAAAAGGLLLGVPAGREEAAAVWKAMEAEPKAEERYAEWLTRWIESVPASVATLLEEVEPSMGPVKEKKLRAAVEAAYLAKLEWAIGSLDASDEAAFERIVSLAVHEEEKIALAAIRRWPRHEGYAERLPALDKLYPKLKHEACRREVFDSMAPGTTEAGAVKLCERGLKDKSAAVRQAAFDRLYRIYSETGDKKIAAKLKDAAAAEKDKETKKRMSDSVMLLPK